MIVFNVCIGYLVHFWQYLYYTCIFDALFLGLCYIVFSPSISYLLFDVINCISCFEYIPTLWRSLGLLKCHVNVKEFHYKISLLFLFFLYFCSCLLLLFFYWKGIELPTNISFWLVNFWVFIYFSYILFHQNIRYWMYRNKRKETCVVNW